MKFPDVASGIRFCGDLAVERGSGRLWRLNPGCGGFGPTCHLPCIGISHRVWRRKRLILRGMTDHGISRHGSCSTGRIFVLLLDICCIHHFGPMRKSAESGRKLNHPAEDLLTLSGLRKRPKQNIDRDPFGSAIAVEEGILRECSVSNGANA